MENRLFAYIPLQRLGNSALRVSFNGNIQGCRILKVSNVKNNKNKARLEIIHVVISLLLL